ncbi:NADAR family protein [Microscilla marina]|uniref:NADAR domain-containing protein n=1 Tax=Microscilla marina ATCC 23134 TaxID=313606 RepID=A1ZX80_MICM2|nr:NADAR domain-containing protein [Microscilla marina]EAY25061.1 conserved hypothetical protein [Microscilla marina ATCC 23134]
MESLKYESLPNIFTKEILEILYKMASEQSTAWHDIFDKMTDEQSLQYADFSMEKQMSQAEDTEQSLTQKEKDAQQLYILKWGAAGRWNDGMNLESEYEYVEKYRKHRILNKYAEVPESVKTLINYMKIDEKFYFFSSSDSPFSTLYKAKFIIQGITYNSVIQYIAHHKARLFLDRGIEKGILKSDSQKEIYQLSLQVKNYDKVTWHNMYLGQHISFAYQQQFLQNEYLKDVLFSTEGKTIVLSDKNDEKWGIGLSQLNSKALQRNTWLGKNFLGEILTRLRIELMGNY